MDMLNNVSLRSYNTMGIDVKARSFAAFSNTDELSQLLEQRANATPLLVLGGGSNILFTKDYDGLVLKNEMKGINIVKEDNNHVYIQTGAGENWHGFVHHCLQRNLAGVENLSLIPGNVGASPMQNIGAYGVEIKDVFEELEAFHIHDKKVHTFSVNDCQFGYRESVFKRQYRDQFIIMNVTYRLNKTPRLNTSYGAIGQELEHMGVQELTIQAVSQAVINIRRSKLPDPNEIGNAGSFFKNPSVTGDHYAQLQQSFPGILGYANADGSVKLAAGWLIEQCGWKGVRRGDAGCHARQALVLVNYGHATGKEIYDLSEDILQSVKARFGVELEREVNII
jgi:UDP-N-acetylmuramate dehydrogenase